jgi:hypothetical protein
MATITWGRADERVTCLRIFADANGEPHVEDVNIDEDVHIDRLSVLAFFGSAALSDLGPEMRTKADVRRPFRIYGFTP